MYATCPKCGHTPAGADLTRESACPACGVIFSKWMKQRFRPETPVERLPAHPPTESLRRELAASLFHVTPNVNPIAFGGRCLTWIGLIVWSGWFFQTSHRELYGHLPEINESFMHLINLAFHEAGHVALIPLGDFMSVLGGSMFQLLVPALVMLAFVFMHENAFGGSVGLWWLGQSAMDLAPYIYDAKHGQLLLIGGFIGAERPGSHDWSNLLGRLRMLDYGHALGNAVNAVGMALMMLALAWGAWVLYLQYRNLDRRF